MNNKFSSNLISLSVYKLYIPERGDSKNVHPEELIIDRGEAEVDKHFRRVNILTITLSGMYYLFYHTEIIECICRLRVSRTKINVILALPYKSSGMTALCFGIKS